MFNTGARAKIITREIKTVSGSTKAGSTCLADSGEMVPKDLLKVRKSQPRRHSGCMSSHIAVRDFLDYRR